MKQVAAHPLSPPPEYREREKKGQRDRMWRCTIRRTGFQPVVFDLQTGRLCYEPAYAIDLEKRGVACS
jgi:hypothetical protein